MPVVGYAPPDALPEPMAFFSYGCCVSTSQALWVLIVTFIVAILMIILCVMSAIFVRWVYKRRMRKKIDALKERYRQEDKEKREREQELLQIAKRPVVPRPLNLSNEFKQFFGGHQPAPNVVNAPLQPQVTHDLAEHTAVDKEKSSERVDPNLEVSMKPPERGEMVFDGSQNKKKTLMVEPATVAGVIHEIAKAEVKLNPEQQPYPHITLGYRQKEVEPTQPDTSSSSTSSKFKPKKKNEETVEEETQKSENDVEMVVMKTQEDSPDEILNKKLKNSKKSSRKAEPDQSGSARRPSEDFPYYQPRNLPRGAKSVTDSSASYQSTQKSLGGIPSPPKVVPEVKRPEPNKQAYNVYELRRLAEEQAGVAETEEACEMIRNRNPAEGEPKKLNLGQPATKRVAQIQKANDLKLEMQSPSP